MIKLQQTDMQLVVGDPVYIYPGAGSRDQNWKEGMVVEQTGPVSFRIKLLCGDIVKRHMDHIRLRKCPPTDMHLPGRNESTPIEYDDSVLLPGESSSVSSQEVQENVMEQLEATKSDPPSSQCRFQSQ